MPVRSQESGWSYYMCVGVSMLPLFYDSAIGFWDYSVSEVSTIYTERLVFCITIENKFENDIRKKRLISLKNPLPNAIGPAI